MDYTVYWFMLPVCIAIASVAMFSGISGAAMLIPVFLIGFPLLDVPPLTTVAAIGTSLFLETSGFGSGVYGYLKRGLVDWRLAGRLILVALPAGALGAVLAQYAPERALKITYGAAMLGLAYLIFSHREGGSEHDAVPERGDPEGAMGERREVVSSSGEIYTYTVHGNPVSMLLSGTGGLFAGMISTGIGESTLPNLVRRVRIPVPVAAATSTVVVAGTVVGAALTHMVQLAALEGFGAIPWNLLAWAVPGAIMGGQIGSRLQGRVDERMTRLFFSGLFFAIGVIFLLAFTLFEDSFPG